MEESFSLEKNILRIRQILDQLQKGTTEFDQHFKLFNEGLSLIKLCQEYLDQSELKIQQLVNDEWEDFSMQNEED